MKFSLRFNNDLPARDYVTYAQAAEAAGFDQFWVSNDLFLRSAPVILAAIATATERIEIGTCILNPYTIHPAEIAMMAATLDELSKGRFNLGISSGAEDFIGWLGLDFDLPRTRIVESIHAINKLTSNEKAATRGRVLRWTEEAWLRFEASRRVPIYLGAMSPKMLEEIGAIADGGLPLLFPPEHYENILPHVEQGLERGGRVLDEIDLAACIWCSISADQEAAEAALADKIAYYGHAMSPLILGQLGLTQQDFEPIRRAYHLEGDTEGARRMVTPQMLRIGIVGGTDALIERLEGLAQLGVRHLSFGPPLGPDIMAAIEVIGRDVIPRYKQQ
ncbi:MAG: LLM class flavin-dependent oxidoreductase [Chloroflexi bacterium]|nr:LLM class flavin-dependent oxidoreductase [Chloroflexota bacterium]